MYKKRNYDHSPRKTTTGKETIAALAASASLLGIVGCETGGDTPHFDSAIVSWVNGQSFRDTADAKSVKENAIKFSALPSELTKEGVSDYTNHAANHLFYNTLYGNNGIKAQLVAQPTMKEGFIGESMRFDELGSNIPNNKDVLSQTANSIIKSKTGATVNVGYRQLSTRGSNGSRELGMNELDRDFAQQITYGLVDKKGVNEAHVTVTRGCNAYSFDAGCFTTIEAKYHDSPTVTFTSKMDLTKGGLPTEHPTVLRTKDANVVVEGGRAMTDEQRAAAIRSANQALSAVNNTLEQLN